MQRWLDFLHQLPTRLRLVAAGVDIAIGCDIPDASGMSTSSAIICYMFLALARANDLFHSEHFKKNLPTQEELYAYLGFIENGQVCFPLSLY
jgi:galactokinase